ncbi:MAG: long-chain fatty acid--CoA ligase [Lentimicrobiaceae bacterium]|nr:long-chain fatty acid--CoA ligase [Lentimicrobiaceae bacterium]
MEEKRLFDILKLYLEKYPNQDVALARKERNGWRKYSIQEYVEITNNLSYALIKLGIKKNDKVGIICGNRPEWNMLDMATMQVGAISVPIYPTISKDDYRYIINDCGVKLVVLEGSAVLQKIESIKSEAPTLEAIYAIDTKCDYPTFNELVELGKENQNPEELKKREDSIDEKECATIIYTSGTTGNPKGVMLSHFNIMSQIHNLKQTPSPWSKKAFSFLPICHAYERMLVFLYQYLGMSVYYAESLATIASDLKDVQPTMMSAVPRLLEKIYTKVKQSGKNNKGIKKIIFLWALNLAERYKIDPCNRTWLYNQKLKIADALVYKKIRQTLGAENFDIVVSGAASIQPNIASFFSAIKMPIYEGYGMTECSPVIAVSCNLPHGREIGTVGFALPGVEVKIAENKEIICRGHNVMMGYYNQPELTKEVIDEDGWLHTGDLGEINEYGQVRITGRLKNLFKTSLGKYINPDVIEGKFAESGFIENIVVLGENQKYAGAIIVPDFAFLKTWCQKHEIPFTTPKEMINNADVKRRYAEEIKKINQNFGDTEKIKRYELIADEWSVNNGILTPTLKVKRNVVKETYKDLIEMMYKD